MFVVRAVREGGAGWGDHPLFSEISPIFPKIYPKNVKNWVILSVSPPQFLHRPLSF